MNKQVNPIPEKIVNYNVYDEGKKLVGVAGEITLPSLEAMSEEISGAGIAGSYESPTPGHFGSITMEIPFRTLIESTFSLLEPRGRTLTFRASQQSYDVASGRIAHRGLKITVKTMPKSISLGTLGIGKPTETSNTVEVMYLKIEENGVVLLELDKINFIFVVNGIDVFADIRKHI